MKKLMKALAAIMLTVAVVFAAGCTKSDDMNNGGDNNGENNGGGNQDHHEYVDLGLPSGTLWATCNVGATTPEGYGSYFAWGETESKETYNWSAYKWCNGGDEAQLTKYCSNSLWGYNGFTDNLTTLQPSDDAATANWGSGWRMPTHEEWVELYENTTNIWTACNGVYGRLFTASNGNRLFLPAAGYHWKKGFDHVGNRGLYWSNMLDASGQRFARSLNFDSNFCLISTLGNYRCDGLSVRPVREN